MSFVVANGPRQGYVPVSPRALLVCVLCLAAIIVSVIVLDRLMIIGSAREPEGGREAAVASAALLKKVELGLLAALVLALLHYLYGCRLNLPYLGVSDAVWPLGPAVALWLLPGINLFFLAVLLRETWRASDPARAQSLFVNWRQSQANGLVIVWLLALVAGLALTVAPWLLMGLAQPADGARGLLDPVILSGIGEVCLIVSYASLAFIAGSLSRRQDLRAMRHDVGALPAWAR